MAPSDLKVLARLSGVMFKGLHIGQRGKVSTLSGFLNRVSQMPASQAHEFGILSRLDQAFTLHRDQAIHPPTLRRVPVPAIPKPPVEIGQWGKGPGHHD